MTTQAKPEFSIGDKVWVVVEDNLSQGITCRDCFGKGALTVILGDDSWVSLACEACRGRGEVSVRVYQVAVREREIDGVRRSFGEVRYEALGSIVDRDKIFTERAAAEAHAESLRLAHEKESTEKHTNKREPNRTWAWHVSYYRKQIRRAETDIIYAKQALAVAEKKAKE